MSAQPHWHEGASPSPGPATPRHFDIARLPGRVASAIWRGSELGSSQDEVVESGFAALDAELPGGGWPRRALIEVLQPQPTLCEWRLLGASLRRVLDAGGQLLLVSPPKHPHLPGLVQHGLRANQAKVIRIQKNQTVAPLPKPGQRTIGRGVQAGVVYRLTNGQLVYVQSPPK